MSTLFHVSYQIQIILKFVQILLSVCSFVYPDAIDDMEVADFAVWEHVAMATTKSHQKPLHHKLLASQSNFVTMHVLSDK